MTIDTLINKFETDLALLPESLPLPFLHREKNRTAQASARAVETWIQDNQEIWGLPQINGRFTDQIDRIKKNYDRIVKNGGFVRLTRSESKTEKACRAALNALRQVNSAPPTREPSPTSEEEYIYGCET